jgi:hypothetical protein
MYAVWVAMRQRCKDPNDRNYKNYGGRGIKVSDEWNDYAVFYKDMGERPEGMQIERIDNDGDYCKENCIWGDLITQANNRRSTTIFTIDGKKVKRTEIQNQMKWSRDQYRRRRDTKGEDWIVEEYRKSLNPR